jgi:FdhD protein
VQTIDLRGLCCPANSARAKLLLKTIAPGETVAILLDRGEPARNVTRSLEAQGYEPASLEEKEGYFVLTLKVPSPGTGLSEAVREYPSVKITRDGSEHTTDPVMVEETVGLIVNGKLLSSIVTVPGLHKELAVGRLVTGGILKDRNDIENVMEKDGRVLLKIRSSGCPGSGDGTGSVGCIELSRDKFGEDARLPVRQTFGIDVLLDGMKNLYDETQDRTGGAHSASLVDADGNLEYKALDIGRHNAVDKVVGMAFLNGENLSKMFLVSSGRQPADMVMKAVRAGIPLIISKAAPVSSGIDCALRFNITLCCFATREKAKVFSAPERIVWI